MTDPINILLIKLLGLGIWTIAVFSIGHVIGERWAKKRIVAILRRARNFTDGEGNLGLTDAVTIVERL